MAVNLTTAKTGVFARLGKIFGIVKRLEQFQEDLVDNASQSFQEAINEYVNTLGATSNTDLEMADALISGLDELRNVTGAAVIARCQEAASKTLVRMVDADTKISLRTVKEALIELNEQMLGSSSSVDGTSITVGTPSSAGTGTGTVLIGTEADNAVNQGILEYPTIRTETLEFKCLRDSATGDVPSGGELFRIQGHQPFSVGDHRWPGGTGRWGVYAATSDNVSDGRSPGVNVLRNSSYNAFDDGNAPVNWDIAVGSAGATVFENTTDPARGVSCLQIRNDGSTNVRLMQQINAKTKTGTRGTIVSDGLYGISYLVKRSGTSPSAGALEVGLFLEDGTAISGNTFTTAHGDISTSYALKTFVFRASLGLSTLPLFFGIKVSTAFTNGTFINIDGLVCARMFQNGPSSPGCMIVPGATDFVKDDTITVGITNNGEGEIERFMDKMFGTYSLGIYVPHNVATAETVADTLVS